MMRKESSKRPTDSDVDHFRRAAAQIESTLAEFPAPQHLTRDAKMVWHEYMCPILNMPELMPAMALAELFAEFLGAPARFPPSKHVLLRDYMVMFGMIGPAADEHWGHPLRQEFQA